MPTNPRISRATYQSRIEKVRRAMKQSALKAIVLEGGTSLLRVSGVRWGRSERTFALVIPSEGDPAWIVPGFEVMRARELVQEGADIRPWEEHENPFEQIAQALREHGVTSGPVGVADDMRFFVFDGIRARNSQLDLVSAESVLKAARL